MKKVKGNIGGAMYLIAMAEIIRRAAENVFKTELPEEDEIVYAGVQAIKASMYGSRRITEDNKAKREFLRNFGLDYTIRLRWYVEGYTEFGALKLILGNHHFIELINLSGLIVAGSKKGLAFKDNLLNDIKTSIYSWVLIDGDNTDIVNVLKNAAKADEMFGMFFISNPDFEFGNFTRDELLEIVWEWAKEFNVEEESKHRLKEATALSSSAKDFFKAVEKAIPYQPQICKGEVWGEKLIRYADKHPKMKLSDGKEIERPIISAIRNALFSHNTNYQRARKDGKVNIETGSIIYPEKK